MTDDTPSPPKLASYVAQIVAAYASHHEVTTEALPKLIQSVHAGLASLGSPPPAVTEALTPAVPIKKSVFADHILCLEDGKSFKTLKRHLEKDHGMTPQQYRERWGLPASYPVVAPSYAATRSALAKGIGLGRKPGLPRAATEVEDAAARGAEPAVRKIPAGKRGRKSKPRRAAP
jgi:predicted transcriptional regulator